MIVFKVKEMFGMKGLPFSSTSQDFACFPLACQTCELFNSYLLLCTVLKLRIHLLDTAHNSVGHSQPKCFL